tara:strand:- start:6340 stop:7107 length:768 start_codon:yes stop_codon:yes gene_type:complete
MIRFDSTNDLKLFLDEMVYKYENTDFIESDPIQIPYQFNKRHDIEISAFLTSIISWGNRKMIIENAKKMLDIMDWSPHDFILNFKENEIKSISFVHRTFNKNDLKFFFRSLKNIYKNHGGLEKVFTPKKNEKLVFESITRFRNKFFSIDHESRTKKHISDPKKKSSCKRINMFLRWMVRDGEVDFNLWKKIPKSILSCPLDTHTLRIANKLKLIRRKSNDLKTLSELDNKLRLYCPNDPVKYDFALFGLGVEKEF